MYIQPNTNVYILRNVPVEPNYEHTIWFDSTLGQYNYFVTLQKYMLNEYSYQRVNKNTIRVEIKADNLYDCNYIMFQNLSYGHKWFYAFINSVNYINDITTEIEYEIDVMQTWLLDHNVNMCFVEREHAMDDSIGANIEPESVDVGEYVYNDYDRIKSFQEMSVIIAICDVGLGGSSVVDGNLYDGIYGSATLFAYDSTDVTAINDKITEYVQKPDAILSIYMLPKALIGEYSQSHKIPYGGSAISSVINLSPVSTNLNLNGHAPVNNKLYTYPYNFYNIDNATGGSLVCRYEFCENNTPIVEIDGTVTQPIEITLYLKGYKGVGSSDTPILTESLTIKGLPVCSWNVDSYEAWLVQNSAIAKLSSPEGMISTALLGVGAYLNPLTAVAGVQTVVSNLKASYEASIKADISKGSFNNGGVSTATHRIGFWGGRMSITRQKAKIIDDYFSMFGYATNQVKVPNRNGRPVWNYVKTAGCTISQSNDLTGYPADVERKICGIYDKGITFWKNGSEVCHYELNNSITN